MARRGVTLWEMAIVLAVMAVAAVLVGPAIARLGTEQPRGSGDALISLLRQSRRAAIDRDVVLTLRIDPVSGRYASDTTGTTGMGRFDEGTLDLGSSDVLVSSQPRLVYIFRPTGATFADTVLVRGADSTFTVAVDPWSGIPNGGGADSAR
jgi:prepilin-type N-terminal cleavage/methylation domain-containing protein